jgi:SAM-dependent methyltransferase
MVVGASYSVPLDAAICCPVVDLEIPDALRDAAAELPPIYADPVRYDVLAQMTAPADLPFYRALVERHGGPVLELGCGTGRVTLELARQGVDVVGVELSPDMLGFAQQKADHEGLDVTLALGDLRRFDLGRTFPLVLLPYNTLNHLLDVDSLRRCFATVQRHMDASSRFVIDTFQPSLAFLGADPERRRPILRYLDPYTQEEVRLLEENHYEPATQKNRIVWSYTIGGREDAHVEELTMRLFFPAELEALLELSGFAVEARYGDYDERPFDSRSPKQLIVCRVA